MSLRVSIADAAAAAACLPLCFHAPLTYGATAKDSLSQTPLLLTAVARPVRLPNSHPGSSPVAWKQAKEAVVHACVGHVSSSSS